MDTFLKQSEPTAVEYPPASGIFTAFLNSETLLKTLNLPEIQRELDTDWVDTLQERLEKEYQATKTFNLGTLSLCYYKQEIYLLNGQHRYEVIKRLDQKATYGKIHVKVEVRKAKTQEDMDAIWAISNSSKSVSIVKNNGHQKIMNGLRKYLQEKYPCFISIHVKPHKPNINLNNLVDKLDSLDFIMRLNIDSVVEMINLVEGINNYYSNKSYDTALWGKGKKGWRIPDFQNLLEKCRNKSPVNPLFLGIFPNFEWLDRIMVNKIEEIPYNQMPHYLASSRSRKIGARLRVQVWEKWNSIEAINERGEAKASCFTCRKDLLQEDFQCGHIKAHFYGGQNSLENLKPICGACNREMGVENLYSYRDRNYPIQN